jgi:DNA-binding XRE family transcriptional regulator
MPNLAATLKEEIRRLARKEVRAETGATRRAAVQHRKEIAKLKKQLLTQQRLIAAMRTKAAVPVKQVPEDENIPLGSRFSSRSVKAQRKRLRLSALQYGKLIGVSAQTVYLWERGKVRPGKAQFSNLIAARGMGRREAAQKLAKPGKSQAPKR